MCGEGGRAKEISFLGSEGMKRDVVGTCGGMSWGMWSDCRRWRGGVCCSFLFSIGRIYCHFYPVFFLPPFGIGKLSI